MGFLLNETPTPEERETYIVLLTEHFRRINLLGAGEGTLEEQVAWMQERHEARNGPEGIDAASAAYKKRFGSHREKSAWRVAFDRYISKEED